MINVLVFATFCVASLSIIAWLFILLHPAKPWDFQPVGDDAAPPPLPDGAAFPRVSVLVPARNEAESLPRTLPALLKQDYPAEFSVYVIDDRSTDGTEAIARDIAQRECAGARLNVIRGAPLPDGWTGKVWALNQGAQAAVASHAEYFLLTDADIFHEPGSLKRLVAESITMQLGMNSRMARLRCESPAEKLLIPAFVYFFNILYPMRRANDPNDPLASAAGGCVLLSREAWTRLGESFEPIKSEIIDDVNLARQIKKRGLPIRLSLSRTEVRSLRDYPHLADIWKMVRRTAFTELRYSWARVAGALAGLGLLFIVPFLAIAVGTMGLMFGAPHIFAAITIVKGFVALAIMGHVYAPAMRFFKLPPVFAFSLPVAGILYGLMTFDSALRHTRGIGVQWREPTKAIEPAK